MPLFQVNKAKGRLVLDRRYWFLISLAIVACSSENPEEARHRKCTNFRDRIVTLRVADLPARSQATVVAQHRAAIFQALGGEFVASCERDYGDAQLDCALASRDLAGVTNCVER